MAEVGLELGHLLAVHVPYLNFPLTLGYMESVADNVELN